MTSKAVCKLITGLCLCVLPLIVSANGNTLLFKKGNDAYAKGQYKDAIAAYQQLINSGYQSAELYYNLGNAYYKSGDNTPALLYFEKAHKLSPGDEDINVNLQFARLHVTDKIEAAPQFFITRWWQSFILSVSLPALSTLSIISFLAASALLIAYLFAGSVSLKKGTFYSGIIIFCIGAIFIFMANRQLHYLKNHHEAIIFSSVVIVKSGPSASAKNLFVLHDGTKVGVLENNNGWIRVSLPNGNEGWIAAGVVKDI